VEAGGLIAAGTFCVIAILVVFNTIRMAIFNRKEEIYMMKLIGASRGFVRGPFLVEAMMYGLMAGGIAAGLTFLGVMMMDDRFDGALNPTVEFMWEWWWLIVAGLIAAGVLIGVVSAMLATRKYLKLR
jgi:cell division transport system permease protein